MQLEPDQRWVGLEIIETVRGDLLSVTGVVEFRAHYERDGASGVLHERSNFRRHEGRWVYIDGAG
jgi:SEC-C motif-containing protein